MHDFDTFLEKIDGTGWYQKKVYFLLCLTNILAGFHMVSSVFLLGDPKHRCALPDYENDTYKIQNDYHLSLVNSSIPPSEDKQLDYDKCIFTTENRTLSCDKWVYDDEVFTETFASKQNLVCDKAIWTSNAQMIFFGGVFFGSLVIGNLADWIGRKTSTCLSLTILFAVTMGIAWTPNFVVFCILRFISGASTSGMFISTFVLGMELFTPEERVSAGVIVQYFFIAGYLIIAGIGYGLRHWKYIEIAVAAPVGVFLIFWWILPESPRWLLSKGKFEQAERILKDIAKENNREFPEGLSEIHDEQAKQENICSMFSSKVLAIRCLVIFFNWFVVSMVYYGLSLNTGNLGGDFYFNFALSGLVEIPANLGVQIVLNRLGRKLIHAACMIFGGLACISTIFTNLYGDESLQPLTVALAMLGKVGASGAFTIIYLWTAELSPTVVRNSVMGTSSACARIGSMSASYIADMYKFVDGDIGHALPYVIFGGLSVLAGVLSLSLPETVGIKMPETIEDGINFGKTIVIEEEVEAKKSQVNSSFDGAEEISINSTQF